MPVSRWMSLCTTISNRALWRTSSRTEGARRIGGGELPIGLDVVVVSALLQCGDFPDQGSLIGNAPIETLAG